jgi:hypothetical protein
MRAMPDAFPHRRRLLQFLIAASTAALFGCANAKRPSSAFDYSRTAGDEKEAGSGAVGNGGAGGFKR